MCVCVLIWYWIPIDFPILFCFPLLLGSFGRFAQGDICVIVVFHCRTTTICVDKIKSITFWFSWIIHRFMIIAINVLLDISLTLSSDMCDIWVPIIIAIWWIFFRNLSVCYDAIFTLCRSYFESLCKWLHWDTHNWA